MKKKFSSLDIFIFGQGKSTVQTAKMVCWIYGERATTGSWERNTQTWLWTDTEAMMTWNDNPSTF